MPAVVGHAAPGCDGADPADIKDESPAADEQRLAVGDPRIRGCRLGEDGAVFLGLDPSEDEVTSNSATHQGKGQNVLYKNGSLSFERHPQVGVGSDNIYTYSGLNESINQNIGDPEGKEPVDASGNVDYTSGPLAQNDSYLVLEKNSTP